MMEFAAMNRDQVALLVALVGVFGVIPIGWLIHDVLKSKRDAAHQSDCASVEAQTSKTQ